MARGVTEETQGGFWSRTKQATARAVPAQAEPEHVDAQVLTLAELFSGEFRFRLTCFQRAYGWRPLQAARLLENIREAMNAAHGKRRYCLGRLMLAKEPGKSETELVDGHQRLMTLTIIFAVLRDLETDPERRAWLHGFVAGGGEQSKAKPSYLLSAQSTPAFFVESLVQHPGATLSEPGMDLTEMSETERNLYENRECIKDELTGQNVSAAFRRDLADFLAGHCRVIAIIVADQDEAWDLIHTEQTTRLNFSRADQAKAVLLTAMPAEDRIVCSRLWEGCEAVLSSTDMHNLLGYIRALKLRGRMKSHIPVEVDIVENFALESGGFAFMEQEFVPSAERLSAIRRGAVGPDGAPRAAVAKAIAHMSMIEVLDWIPAALQWIARRGDDEGETVLFFRRLERLLWIGKIAGMDPGVFETRILDLNVEIERWLKVDAMSRLQIEPELKAAALTTLRSEGIAAKQLAGLALRRISIGLGADPGPMTRDKVTLEHILPRSPPASGPWRKDFKSPEDVKENFQRLGNLTLLSGPQNQKAGTHDWPTKKAILATSGFVLAARAATETAWTAKTIARRTEELITLLFRQFDLDV